MSVVGLVELRSVTYVKVRWPDGAYSGVIRHKATTRVASTSRLPPYYAPSAAHPVGPRKEAPHDQRQTPRGCTRALARAGARAALGHRVPRRLRREGRPRRERGTHERPPLRPLPGGRPRRGVVERVRYLRLLGAQQAEHLPAGRAPAGKGDLPEACRERRRGDRQLSSRHHRRATVWTTIRWPQ